MRRITVPLLLVLAVSAAAIGGLLIPRGGGGTPALAGTVLTERAPDFTLHDQQGRMVSLHGLRGRPVLLTFLAASCTETCPVVAETIRRTLAELGPAARRVTVLAVSTDPEDDTSTLVRHFSEQHGLYHVWHYLSGSRHALTPVWNAYHLYVAPANAPKALQNAHTSATFLIDSSGKERVLMTNDPGTDNLARDLRILMGVSVGTPLLASVPAPQAGHRAPALSLPLLGGARVTASSMRGKVVLLNFWATWCTACRSEMPALERWYRAMRGQGVLVVGIDKGESSVTVAAYAQKLGVHYPLALDDSGDVSARYDISALPTTILINRQGVVESVHIGVLDSTYLTRHVAPLLKQ
jgi:protein SCO1